MIRAQFDRFANPLIYTPGDNEWTDCHRLNNGGYDPLERLAFDRSVFFDRPGMSLGQDPTKVDSQSAAGFPENVRLRRQGVQFAVVHVVGSNNGLAPWTGATEANARQIAEEAARMDKRDRRHPRCLRRCPPAQRQAVAIFLQADMFDPTYTPAWKDISAFQPLIQVLVDESSDFAGEVYLFDGDSHVYNHDRPLATGSPWLATYGITGSADNLQRVTSTARATTTTGCGSPSTVPARTMSSAGNRCPTPRSKTFSRGPAVGGHARTRSAGGFG